MLHDAVRATVERAVGVGGGVAWQARRATGWGEAWTLATADARYFVKLASGRYAPMLACEADGLAALARTSTVGVPHVAAVGACGATAFLAMDALDLTDGARGAALGRALALLHRAQTPRGPAGERFGWHRDNFIGATPQANGWCGDWCAFFRERRLAPQLALAAANGFGGLQRDGECLLAMLPRLLDHRPEPSLVHGDLWSGNAATLRDGAPVVFDPAVYVGDREVDIAMTELFGGFGADFRSAYQGAWPLGAGYRVRRDVYNLYHVLNHLNLFGAGYLGRVETTLAALVARGER
jgi:protein-ribulosamine 3-kinase